MIDEIDYFQRRDKFKKKKDLGLDEDWNALKKKHNAPARKTPVDPDAKEKGKNPPSPGSKKNPTKPGN